ncbi:MAG: transglutaminase-like domain-containing protein [Kiloniellales bacterium]|nr:transglutaminase-like domain-containing protein [Kiloniellales bacterium]
MSWSSASGRKELEARLRQIGGQDDEGIDLAPAALLLAALDRPKEPLERYLHHLSLLERDTADFARKLEAEDSLTARVDALNAVMVERYEYEGDVETYEDLQNANLMRVIDRRRGLPVALAILYIHAARGQDWEVAGLNFPGHFLLRLDLAGERVILDPFNGGRVRDTAALRDLLKAVAGNEAELEPRHYAPMSNRGILLRLQSNIKLRLMRQKKHAEALATVESMLMIAPDQPALWREAGLLNANLGNLRAAMMSLEQFVDLGRDAQAVNEAVRLIKDLKSRLN